MFEDQQPNEQARFIQSYSTIDHLFTINQVLEKTQASDRNTPTLPLSTV